MANITALLAALANLPAVQGAPQLTPQQPGPVTPPFVPMTIPDLAPPVSGTLPMPEPPPRAPGAPVDQSIIQQYLALLGPAPTPPPQQAQPGALGKIALALQGFAAGTQGRGGDFLAQLNEQRERPKREYEARLDRYNTQKAQFGLAGIEAATRAEERRQERQQALADKQFEIEVQTRARQLGFKHEEDITNLRAALESKRDREQNEAQTRLTLLQLDSQDKRLDREIQAADKRLDKQQAFDLRLKRMEIAAAAARASQGERITAMVVGADGKSLGTLPYTQLRFNEFGEPHGFPKGTTIRLSSAPAVQPTAQAGGGTSSGLTREAVENAIKGGAKPDQLRAGARTQEEKVLIEQVLAGQGGARIGPDTRPEAQRAAETPINRLIQGIGPRYAAERKKQAERIEQY